MLWMLGSRQPAMNCHHVTVYPQKCASEHVKTREIGLWSNRRGIDRLLLSIPSYPLEKMVLIGNAKLFIVVLLV